MKTKKQGDSKAAVAFRVIKGALAGTGASILLVLGYALVLKEELLDETSMSMVVTLIKVVCGGLAALLAVTNCPKRRWIVGGITGIAYIALSFIVFALLAGQIRPDLGVLTDLCIGGLAGMLVGLLKDVFR